MSLIFYALCLFAGALAGGFAVALCQTMADPEPDDDDLIRALRFELAEARREALSVECANEVLRSRLAAAMREGGR